MKKAFELLSKNKIVNLINFLSSTIVCMLSLEENLSSNFAEVHIVTALEPPIQIWL